MIVAARSIMAATFISMDKADVEKFGSPKLQRQIEQLERIGQQIGTPPHAKAHLDMLRERQERIVKSRKI